MIVIAPGVADVIPVNQSSSTVVAEAALLAVARLTAKSAKSSNMSAGVATAAATGGVAANISELNISSLPASVDVGSTFGFEPRRCWF